MSFVRHIDVRSEEEARTEVSYSSKTERGAYLRVMCPTFQPLFLTDYCGATSPDLRGEGLLSPLLSAKLLLIPACGRTFPAGEGKGLAAPPHSEHPSRFVECRSIAAAHCETS